MDDPKALVDDLRDRPELRAPELGSGGFGTGPRARWWAPRVGWIITQRSSVLTVLIKGRRWRYVIDVREREEDQDATTAIKANTWFRRPRGGGTTNSSTATSPAIRTTAK